MILDERLVREIRRIQSKLADEGKLCPPVQLQDYYETFRRRFGPERLQGLDGEALLITMHNHSDRDSLVYWLEFKNDDELPTILFGSIGGGSALKFGIYRRRETGLWMAGAPQDQRKLSTEEAVQIARKHRDQLVRGAELLERLPANATDADYAALQEAMAKVAPDVSDLVWGHKYFSMLYPDKLDDYHNPDYQRFHLIRLWQVPPEGRGRYLAAGRYVAIAGELGMPLNHLSAILNYRDGGGGPYRYWRVLVNYPHSEGFENNWDLMRNGGYAAIGWADLGDLSDIQRKQESKERVRSLMRSHYGETGRWADEIFSFVAVMAEGDLVLAFERSTVLGIGRVVGPYLYAPSTPKIPHHRPVEWLSEGKWDLPQVEAKSKATSELKHPANLVEIERRIFEAPLPPPPPPPPGMIPQLKGVPGRIQSILERKGQVILYGPPGTGKTYWAIRTAHDLAAHFGFGKAFDQLTEEQRQFVTTGNDQGSGGLVRMCSFNPAYGYEDFLEGYKPTTVDNQLVFERRDGIFKRLCEDAQRDPSRRFYLVIDEINRGDIPRIFGELLTVLEKDKRGRPVLLPLSGVPFYVPDNVYIVGTMNTADRSIALLDTALRRRFGFIELMPDSSILRDTVVGSIPLAPWLDALNCRICKHIGRDARNLQIGHAYLLDNGQPVSDFARFAKIVQDDIVPLLEEYCYDDYAALGKILGEGLVDGSAQRIRHELFDSPRRDDLTAALLAPCPEIVTSAQAVVSEAEEPEESPDEDDEQDVEETVPPV